MSTPYFSPEAAYKSLDSHRAIELLMEQPPKTYGNLMTFCVTDGLEHEGTVLAEWHNDGMLQVRKVGLVQGKGGYPCPCRPQWLYPRRLSDIDSTRTGKRELRGGWNTPHISHGEVPSRPELWLYRRLQMGRCGAGSPWRGRLLSVPEAARLVPMAKLRICMEWQHATTWVPCGKCHQPVATSGGGWGYKLCNVCSPNGTCCCKSGPVADSDQEWRKQANAHTPWSCGKAEPLLRTEFDKKWNGYEWDFDLEWDRVEPVFDLDDEQRLALWERPCIGCEMPLDDSDLIGKVMAAPQVGREWHAYCEPAHVECRERARVEQQRLWDERFPILLSGRWCER